MSNLKSPIKYLGGKSYLVKWLLSFVPTHKYYLEVFGGGGSLLFAKSPAQFEVFNDIDEGLFTFYSVLRDPNKFRRFYRRVQLTLYSRKGYCYAKDHWKECTDEIEKARMWYVLARMGFSGRVGEGWGYVVTESNRGMAGSVSGWLSALDLLPQNHQRLKRCQIENLDWRECLEKYQWPFDEEFIYLDPPYLPSTRKGTKYLYELSTEDHERLIDYLITHKRRVMLSGYNNDLYRQLEEHGFKRFEKKVDCCAYGRTRGTECLDKDAAKSRESRQRTEYIWINYDLDQRTLF